MEFSARTGVEAGAAGHGRRLPRGRGGYRDKVITVPTSPSTKSNLKPSKLDGFHDGAFDVAVEDEVELLDDVFGEVVEDPRGRIWVDR